MTEMSWCLQRKLIMMNRQIRPCIDAVRTLCERKCDPDSGMEVDLEENNLDFFPLEHKPKLSKHIKGEILFGIHPVQQALEQRKRKVHKLLVKEGISNDQVKDILKLVKNMAIKKIWVKKLTLENLSGKRPHQGVCLDVDPLSFPEINPSHINFSGNNPLWVLLYKVLDPMNVGAIIRTAYFLGVDRIITLDKKSGSLNPVVSKASSGAMEVMQINICPESSLHTFFEAWKRKGGIVVGSAGDKACESLGTQIVPLSNFNSHGKPLLFIAGNEMKGIDKNVLTHCDAIVNIEPAANVVKGIDSLNVAVATSIALHHIISQMKNRLITKEEDVHTGKCDINATVNHSQMH